MEKRGDYMNTKYQDKLTQTSIDILAKRYPRLSKSKMNFINHSYNIVILESEKYLYRINIKKEEIKKIKKRDVSALKFELLTDIYYDAYLLEKKHQRINNK